MKGLGILYEKMKRCYKKIFLEILDRIFEKLYICIKNAYLSLIINTRIIIHTSDKRTWNPLQENEMHKMPSSSLLTGEY